MWKEGDQFGLSFYNPGEKKMVAACTKWKQKSSENRSNSRVTLNVEVKRPH